jgi:hypothetical protein
MAKVGLTLLPLDTTQGNRTGRARHSVRIGQRTERGTPVPQRRRLGSHALDTDQADFFQGCCGRESRAPFVGLMPLGLRVQILLTTGTVSGRTVCRALPM